jgi:hypothetical protein
MASGVVSEYSIGTIVPKKKTIYAISMDGYIGKTSSDKGGVDWPPNDPIFIKPMVWPRTEPTDYVYDITNWNNRKEPIHYPRETPIEYKFRDLNTEEPLARPPIRPRD